MGQTHDKHFLLCLSYGCVGVNGTHPQYCAVVVSGQHGSLVLVSALFLAGPRFMPNRLGTNRYKWVQTYWVTLCEISCMP